MSILRSTSRLPLRTAPAHLLRAGQRHQRRNIGFAGPALKRRSWKSSFARWGIAAGGLYWYTSSDLDLFNKEANEHGRVGSELLDVSDEAQLPTVESIIASRRERQRATLSASPQSESTPPSSQLDSSSASQTSLKQDISQASSAVPVGNSAASTTTDVAPPSSPGALEEEAESEGAFNEETGEINWDCPCLGGMAHGPCGEQFREAFSCFVYSKEEPKGVDCIDRFKNMQDCFRAHPDVYGAELTDDVDEDGNPIDPASAPEPAAAAVAASEGSASSTPTTSPPPPTELGSTAANTTINQASKKDDSAQGKDKIETNELLPKAAYDTTDMNRGAAAEK